MTEESNKTFKGHSDRFQGITVFSDAEQCISDEFPDKLDGNFTLKL